MSKSILNIKLKNRHLICSRNNIRIQYYIPPDGGYVQGPNPPIAEYGTFLPETSGFANEITSPTTEQQIYYSSNQSNTTIPEAYVAEADFSSYKTIDDLSKVELYYLGLMGYQEAFVKAHSAIPGVGEYSKIEDIKYYTINQQPNQDLYSELDYNHLLEKIVLIPNFDNLGTNLLGDSVPLYDIFLAARHENWFATLPNSYLTNEFAKITMVSRTKDSYFLSADWDPTIVDAVDVIYGDTSIITRVDNQEFVPVQKYRRLASTREPIEIPVEFGGKQFQIQPIVDGFAVSNSYMLQYHHNWPANWALPVGATSPSQDLVDRTFLDAYIEYIGLEEFRVYYRLQGSDNTSDYYIKIFDPISNVIYISEKLESFGGIITFSAEKKIKKATVQLLYSQNVIYSSEELISYRYLANGSLPIEVLSTSVVPQSTSESIFKCNIKITVDSDRKWLPNINSLSDFDIDNSVHQQEVQEAKLVYHLVITKIIDGKYYDTDKILINRGPLNKPIIGTDGEQFQVTASGMNGNKYILEYESSPFHTGGSIVINASLRVYPLSIYMYEKRDILFEYIDNVERGNVVITKRIKTFFRDHPGISSTGTTPTLYDSKIKNLQLLDQSSTFSNSTILFESHNPSTTKIEKIDDINIYKSSISILVQKENLYYEKQDPSSASSVIPYSLPYQIIDITLDDEIRKQILAIELFSVKVDNESSNSINAISEIENNTEPNIRTRPVGIFTSATNIRAVDYSSAAILFASKWANQELPYDPENGPPETPDIFANLPDPFPEVPANQQQFRTTTQFVEHDSIKLVYVLKLILNHGEFSDPIFIKSEVVEIDSQILPTPLIFDQITLKEAGINLLETLT